MNVPCFACCVRSALTQKESRECISGSVGKVRKGGILIPACWPTVVYNQKVPFTMLLLEGGGGSRSQICAHKVNKIGFKDEKKASNPTQVHTQHASEDDNSATGGTKKSSRKQRKRSRKHKLQRLNWTVWTERIGGRWFASTFSSQICAHCRAI